jgi:hypothetical protein
MGGILLMDDGHFYFLHDNYFIDFPDPKLEKNKETINGEFHNRPCFCAFAADSNQIFWLIPVSSINGKGSRTTCPVAGTPILPPPLDVSSPLPAQVRSIERFRQQVLVHQESLKSRGARQVILPFCASALCHLFRS